MTADARPRAAQDPGRCFDLTFSADGAGRSFLAEQFACYPVHLCRGLHTNAALPDVCTVTLQSVSGGLFENDRLSGRLTARSGAWAQVTSSASTIVHSMRSAWAEQGVELRSEGSACLEYLPEPLILFPASRLRSRARLCASGASTVVCGEAFLVHDPAATGAPFDQFESLVDVVRDDGRLLARERMQLRGDTWQARRVGVSNRCGVQGSLWIIRGGDCGDLLQAIRAELDRQPVYAGASDLPNRAGLLVRLLADDVTHFRQALRAVQDRVQHFLIATRSAKALAAALA